MHIENVIFLILSKNAYTKFSAVPLIQHNGTILRILAINDSAALVIDCLKRNMPHWCNIATIESFVHCTEHELAEQTDVELFDIESLDAATRKIVHDRYTIIAGVLPFIADDKMRSIPSG